MFVFLDVSLHLILSFTVNIAKKEEHPEEALKEFRAIVDQETDKGDWFVLYILSFLFIDECVLLCAGVLRLSNNLRSFSS
jgi:hypothetical protein